MAGFNQLFPEDVPGAIAGGTYNEGDIVIFGGNFYGATATVTLSDPVAITDFDSGWAQLSSGDGVSELSDLSDVDTVTVPPGSADLLVWNPNNDQWVPGSSITGITGLPEVSIPIAPTATVLAVINDDATQATLTASVVDPDQGADPFTFEWVAGTGGNIVSGADTNEIVVDANATYTLTVTDSTMLTDTVATDVVLIGTGPSIVVTIANNTNAGDIETPTAGDVMSFTWTAMDSDGTIDRYLLQAVDENDVILRTIFDSTTDPTQPQTDTITLDTDRYIFTVTDDNDFDGQDIISVDPQPDVLLLTAGSGTLANAGSWSFTVSGAVGAQFTWTTNRGDNRSGSSTIGSAGTVTISGAGITRPTCASQSTNVTLTITASAGSQLDTGFSGSVTTNSISGTMSGTARATSQVITSMTLTPDQASYGPGETITFSVNWDSTIVGSLRISLGGSGLAAVLAPGSSIHNTVSGGTGTVTWTLQDTFAAGTDISSGVFARGLSSTLANPCDTIASSFVESFRITA